jgi:hypothetical protein
MQRPLFVANVFEKHFAMALQGGKGGVLVVGEHLFCTRFLLVACEIIDLGVF